MEIAPTERRITCEVIGRPKLLATITPEGIWSWCRICHCAHIIPRAVVMAVWSEGEREENKGKEDEHCSQYACQ